MTICSSPDVITNNDLKQSSHHCRRDPNNIIISLPVMMEVEDLQ